MAGDFELSLSYALSCLQLEGLQVKDKQREAIHAVYDGKDVFLWLPTGYGKSLCYQCLPFLFDHKLSKVDLPPSKRSVCLARCRIRKHYGDHWRMRIQYVPGPFLPLPLQRAWVREVEAIWTLFESL